jgi:hypothetical protein
MPTHRPWLAAAGLVYVAAWVVGLVIDPHAPDLMAPAGELAAFYQAHGAQHLAQIFLIHGVAALALVSLAAALWGALHEDTDTSALATLSFGAAVVAASLSLTQAALGATLVSPPLLAGDAAIIRAIRALINTLDTFKLLALALFVGASVPLALSAGVLPRWLGWMGGLLVLSLIAGGLSFIVSPMLAPALYLALPLLLLWAGVTGVVLLRGTVPTASHAPPALTR